MYKKLTIVLAFAVILLLAYVFTLRQKQSGESIDFLAGLSGVDRMYNACNQSLINNTSILSMGPELNQLPKEASVVNLHGYGELDAKIYRELKASSVQLCDKIKQACDKGRSEFLCEMGFKFY